MANGFAVLTGHVKVRQDLRTISADRVTYDQKTGKVTVNGSVDFEDPRLGVTSESGAYDALGGANFDEANFHIFDRNGRGFAREMEVHPDGTVGLAKVRYTSCPAGNQDWMLQASSLKLDTDAQQGVAHQVVMRFKDVPIFYTPYIAFPLGRRSARAGSCSRTSGIRAATATNWTCRITSTWRRTTTRP